MIERYDPFGRMMSLRQMMDRMLEDAFIMPREGRTEGMGNAALNMYEEGDNLVVEAQLPGMKPEDVDVSVERGMLTIRGQTKAEEERKERNYLVREHRTGSFMRSVRLPETADPDKAKATFDNGVLRLTFPKSEQAKPRRIQIGSGGQQALGSEGRTSSGLPLKEQDQSSRPTATGSRSTGGA